MKTNLITDQALQIIENLNMQPHPEGGYFTPHTKSSHLVYSDDVQRYNGEKRRGITSIYYLLDQSDFSAWHSLKSDEIWHHYQGSPVTIYVIDHAGKLQTHLLGEDYTYQICIEADSWFAAENTDKTSFSLIGCTVAPGFEYTDFKIAKQSELRQQFPHHADIINKLSRG